MPAYLGVRLQRNEPLGGGFYRLLVEIPAGVAEFAPGQFAMVRLPGSFDPLLPRPLAVCGLRAGAGLAIVEFVLRVVGRGTRLLAALRPGDALDVTYPLGRGFSEPAPGERAVRAAGGHGVVPLWAVAQRAAAAGRCASIILLVGARSAAGLALLERFEGSGIRVEAATEDGGKGSKGMVSDLLGGAVGGATRIYACGPGPMLRAVARIAAAAGVPAEVSLESRMACGTGLCQGCAVRGADGRMRQVCREGPVFSAEEIFGGER